MYYVYDILTDEWSSGGTKKIFTANKRYLNDIPPRSWRTALDGFFDKSMSRNECKQIPNPRGEEYVILNCIYLSIFTAMDQLSIDRFDVEHIAPKEQMRKLIQSCQGTGLPVSCIANLCYLPEYVNRSKRDKNFYQDNKYLQKVNINEIESKYSFTRSTDLEWMDMPYERPEDFALLQKLYTDFCVTRFAIMKKLFCKSMCIDYEKMNDSYEDQKSFQQDDIVIAEDDTDYYSLCAAHIEAASGIHLVKISKKVYKTLDGKKGYIILISKAYEQGNRQKYWFGYRRTRLPDIHDCHEQYIVCCCKDTEDDICFPVSQIEHNLDRLSCSIDEGIITHWHIVLYRDSEGNMTQLLSKPDNEEVSVNEYKI